MKKRHHLRSDGEVSRASILERIGCMVFILILITVGIIGFIQVIKMILKIF